MRGKSHTSSIGSQTPKCAMSSVQCMDEFDYYQTNGATLASLWIAFPIEKDKLSFSIE